jgi:hypothetical protein
VAGGINTREKFFRGSFEMYLFSLLLMIFAEVCYQKRLFYAFLHNVFGYLSKLYGTAVRGHVKA